MRHPSIRSVAALSAFLVCGAACRTHTRPAAEPEEFAVGQPSIGATYARELVGQIQAVRHAEFRAHHRGLVEQLAIDEGQRVKSGDLMFSISARELEHERTKADATVASAVAELKAAQVEAANTRLLFDNDVVSRPELELAQARVEALDAHVREAKAEAQQAAVRLAFARVYAPFDGVVNRLPHRVGSLVLEDEIITTLADTSEVFVYFRVSEQEYLEHTARAEDGHTERVRLRLANGAEYPHPGTIDAVEGEFDRDSGTIAFRARFPNPDGLLKHGATGKIVLERDAADAIVIPQSATFEVQDHIYVYTVDGDDVVHATRVVPRARVGQGFVVDDGIAATDRIVLAGAQRLRDGAQIIARDAAEPPTEEPPAAPPTAP